MNDIKIEQTALNFLKEYFDNLEGVLKAITLSYQENDVREMWKWTKFLYVNIRPFIKKQGDKKKLDEKSDEVENDIYSDNVGDKLTTLYIVDNDAVAEHNRQKKLVLEFYEEILEKMKEAGILKTYVDVDPSMAVMNVR